ncbi:MAG: hypothetical protein LC624_05745, partial [Halobacteriales archaeon]|nr:hypothetical protein [Halobacteriales archaeon]
PQHPYTRALIDAIPQPDPARRGAARALRGEVPDAAHPPAGCRFHPRCPVSEARCGFEPADLREVAEQHAAKLPPLATWEEGHQRLRIPGARPELVQRLARAGAPGLAEAARIEASGSDTLVSFPPAEPIAMRAQGERQVRCLLYADAEHAAHAPR